MNPRRQQARVMAAAGPAERIAVFSIAAAAITLALGAYSHNHSPDLTDVPLIGASGRLLYLLMLLAVLGFGYQTHRLWDRPATAYTPYPPLPSAWILPTLTLLSGLLLVAHYHDWAVVVMAAVIAGSGVYAALTVRESLDGAGVADGATAQAVHSVLSVVVALINLSLIYGFRMRTIYSAPAVFVVALLLLLQIHDGIPAYPIRRVAYALVGAFALAELVWPLNYLPPSGWYGGGALAVVFLGYALMTRAQLRSRLNQAVAMQYAALTAALFAVVIVLGR